MTQKRISMKGIFDGVGYSPHAMQTKVHAAKANSRFRVVCAGRRTGKSTLGGHELTIHAMEAYMRREYLDPLDHRMEYWIVGPEYSDAEKEFRVLYSDLQKLEMPFDKPGTYYNADAGNMSISLWGGRFQVHAKSAKYPDSLVGEALYGAIFAEAAKLKPAIWSKYIRPMLADYRGWAMMTSTPEGKNWFYDAYMRGLEGGHGWYGLRMPSWSNPIVYPQGRNDPEIKAMEYEMTEDKFNQEIGADFSDFVGRVFKDFDEETHVGHYRYDPRWPLFVAVDFGYTNPTVVLFVQADIWDNVWVVGEYYMRHKTPTETANDILADPRLGPLSRKAIRMYPDPEDPGAAATISSILRIPTAAGTGGLISDRLELIRRWLKVPKSLEYLDEGHKERKPKLHFDYSCVNTIREMGEYRYPENKTEANERENPMKKDDHAPEALGRFFAGHYGSTLERKQARQRTAKVRRKAA